MKRHGRKMEILFIPVSNGRIKVHIFGFHIIGSWGQVFAELNGTTVNAKGFQKKKTIIRCITKLHEKLLK